MRTAISDQTELSKRVAKQHQGLTQDAHGLGRPRRHLGAGGDRVPVATQQLAHFGAGPYPRQKLVVFRRHHVRALYISRTLLHAIEIFGRGATPHHFTGSSGKPSKNRLSAVSVLKEADSASPSSVASRTYFPPSKFEIRSPSSSTVSKNPFRFANSSSSLSVFWSIEPSWKRPN